MNEGFTEARTAIWALAEVCWIDAAGQSLRAPATLEDTSPSGACIRVKTPISVGSNLTVKWHREQFSGVARNCRTDGREFVLGIQRQGSGAAPANAVAEVSAQAASESQPQQAAKALPHVPPLVVTDRVTDPAPTVARKQEAVTPPLHLGTGQAVVLAAALGTIRQPATNAPRNEQGVKPSPRTEPAPVSKPALTISATVREATHHQERNTMESKGLLPKFWRREAERASQDHPPSAASSAEPHTPAEDARGRASELLSYDDIYRAAGILGPRSGYGIHKVLDMLNSDRIRDLTPEIKRASVLMAIEAAGASVDDVLQDAMRRQHALDTYDAGQQKQIEEFESYKTKENAQIQAEMERITAHYAERIQRNQDRVAQEKEALRNWQMAKQHESQRIAEVMSLCMREPAPATNTAPAAAAARAGAGSSRAASLGPSLLPDITQKA